MKPNIIVVTWNLNKVILAMSCSLGLKIQVVLAISIMFVLSICFSSCSSSRNLPSIPLPYFSAFIVSDMEKSLKWYSNNFDLEIINDSAFPERGFRQANLQNANMLVELIELDSAKSTAELIPNYNSKTRFHGFFKLGFHVRKFDDWIKFMRTNQVAFHGDVVTQDSGKRMVLILDPDGNRIQFFER